MNSSIPSDASPLPDRIVTHWRRFSSGLWRVPKGDIADAYCADTFPKVKVFTHEGRLFTNCGGHHSGTIHVEAGCYPLVPAEAYRGPEPRRYSYEGREAAWKGRVFRLGPQVIFVASDPTVEEWRRLLRVLYADGGMFAADKSYTQMLQQFRESERVSTNERAAIDAEQAGTNLPETQSDMLSRLEGKYVIPVANQLELTWEAL